MGFTLALASCRDAFEPFSGCHVLAVVLCLLLAAAWMLGGACARTPRAERRVRLAWAWGIVMWQAWTITYWLLPARFDLDKSLPLHLCDLAPWAAAWALARERPWARALLYFWGIGLCTQAFVTPVVRVGWASWEFWFFWVQHTQIVGAAAYEIAIRRYRPDRRALRLALRLSYLYVGLMLAINIALGTNYGYVGAARPDAPTIIDRLGAWPVRVVWLVLIVHGLFVLLWWAGSRRALNGASSPAP